MDVRKISPPERHPQIFKTFDELKDGESFFLVNDHNPKPLYYQLMHEREGLVKWEDLESGPEVWRVRVTKTEPGAGLKP
jgi:uncharacterized protein (DUF2249 family)